MYDDGNWSSKKFPELAYNNFSGNNVLWKNHKKNILLLFKHYKLL